MQNSVRFKSEGVMDFAAMQQTLVALLGMATGRIGSDFSISKSKSIFFTRSGSDLDPEKI